MTKHSIILLTIAGLLIPISVFGLIMRATVETKLPSSITLSSIRLNGDVTDDGGCSELELWFEHGKTTSYGRTTQIQERNYTGNFSATVSGLSACTTYHFRAAARNNTKKTGYGEDRTFTTKCPTFSLSTAIKNLTREDTVWYKSISADPGDELLFRTLVNSTSNLKIRDVKVKVNLALGIIYEGELIVNDKSYYEDITLHALDIGDITANQTKAITFKARVAKLENLSPKTDNLISTILIYTPYISKTDNFIIKIKGLESSGVPIAHAAGPTDVVTGVTGNIILDSLLLPLGISLLLVWIFRSKLVGFDRWSVSRKKEIREYRANKQLKRKIAQVK